MLNLRQKVLQVQANASSNDLYGFRFLIPLTLFDPDRESKIMIFHGKKCKRKNQ